MKPIIPQILLLPLLLWFVWSLDIWTAVSLLYPAYLIIAAISCGLLLLPFAFSRRWRVAIIPCIWLTFIVALPFVTNSSLKPMMWGVLKLELGMDHDTVMETLTTSYAGTKYPIPIVRSEEQRMRGQTQITRLLIKPQGRPPELQAESLLLFFEDGAFKRSSFSAD